MATKRLITQRKPYIQASANKEHVMGTWINTVEPKSHCQQRHIVSLAQKPKHTKAIFPTHHTHTHTHNRKEHRDTNQQNKTTTTIVIMIMIFSVRISYMEWWQCFEDSVLRHFRADCVCVCWSFCNANFWCCTQNISLILTHSRLYYFISNVNLFAFCYVWYSRASF